MLEYNSYPPDRLRETVEHAAEVLGEVSDSFDSIAVRGVSGLMVGSPVALALGKPLVVVRKPEEYAHGGMPNYNYAGDRYLILDDFVSLGRTVDAIKQGMSENTNARFAGSYMYRRDELEMEGQ